MKCQTWMTLSVFSLLQFAQDCSEHQIKILAQLWPHFTDEDGDEAADERRRIFRSFGVEQFGDHLDYVIHTIAT